MNDRARQPFQAVNILLRPWFLQCSNGRMNVAGRDQNAVAGAKLGELRKESATERVCVPPFENGRSESSNTHASRDVRIAGSRRPMMRWVQTMTERRRGGRRPFVGGRTFRGSLPRLRGKKRDGNVHLQQNHRSSVVATSLFRFAPHLTTSRNPQRPGCAPCLHGETAMAPFASASFAALAFEPSGSSRPAYRAGLHIRRRPSWAAVGRRRLSDPSCSKLKRVMDVGGAGVALVCLSPLLIIVAAAIKATSPGPIVFTQKRYGYRNHRFRIYKFRTMYMHVADVSGVRQTTSEDPRVTPVGRLLRHTSLDELPQLINVLRGDMSLVGPRPHVPGMQAGGVLYEHLVPYYRQRHSVRPGITGLAQVNGCRGSTREAPAAISRIDYDLEYIEKWSLFSDVTILFKTIRREFLSGSGI